MLQGTSDGEFLANPTYCESLLQTLFERRTWLPCAGVLCPLQSDPLTWQLQAIINSPDSTKHTEQAELESICAKIKWHRKCEKYRAYHAEKCSLGEDNIHSNCTGQSSLLNIIMFNSKKDSLLKNSRKLTEWEFKTGVMPQRSRKEPVCYAVPCPKMELWSSNKVPFLVWNKVLGLNMYICRL